MSLRFARRHALALAASSALAPTTFAQGTFPDRAVNMIVPFAPGGTPDIAARLMAPKMAELLGQPVTVENRAGAGATIGTRAVVQARPDGHTILMGSISFLTAPLTADPMPYDPVAQLRVISLISTSPYVLIVRADSPARDIAGFHAWTRELGNKLNYGSSGSGTPLHLGGELYKLRRTGGPADSAALGRSRLRLQDKARGQQRDDATALVHTLKDVRRLTSTSNNRTNFVQRADGRRGSGGSRWRWAPIISTSPSSSARFFVSRGRTTTPCSVAPNRSRTFG